jgi:SAM-dependent methyltransferase
MRPSEQLAIVGGLVREVGDVLAERVHEPTPPTWAAARGWTRFLLGLDDASLERCEHGDTAVELASMLEAPASLREVAHQVVEATRVRPTTLEAEVEPLRRASERKRLQVATLGALVRDWAPRARRIVDLGAGHGHLTRELARTLELEALGIEERAHVVANAQALTDNERVRFVAHDALAAPVELAPDDLVVGLHACGALGDALVEAAARAQSGVLLVSCCPQKRGTPERAPLSRLGAELGLTVAREHLGLANMATLAQGGVDSAEVMERRRTRYALYLLLRDAGVSLRPGDEMEGLHRRHLRHPLEVVAPRAFAARDLRPPSAHALDDAKARAQREHDVVRRLSLPRTMLGRLLELALVLDRATLLEERGGALPEVRAAFDREASPRNLAVLRAPRHNH